MLAYAAQQKIPHPGDRRRGRAMADVTGALRAKLPLDSALSSMTWNIILATFIFGSVFGSG